jgi:hypothetical protein
VKRTYVLLLPVAMIAIALDAVAIAGVHGAPRAVAAAREPPAPAVQIQAPMHTQPDVADYNTIATERRSLTETARGLLVKIGMCERSIPDPYGGGLTSLNNCLSAPVRENILRARVEPLMFTGVMRNMQSGPCSVLTSGLMEGLAQLGEASYAWSADVEVPGPAQGRQEFSDVRDLRIIAGQIIRVAGSGGWRSACRPRPYDPVEHGSAPAPSRDSPGVPSRSGSGGLLTRLAV